MYEAKGSRVRKRVLGEKEEKTSPKETSPKSTHEDTVPTSDKKLTKAKPNVKLSEEARLENPQIPSVQWWGALAFVTLLCIATRLYKIEVPSQIW